MSFTKVVQRVCVISNEYSTATRMPKFIKILKQYKKEPEAISQKKITQNYVEHINKSKNKEYVYLDEDEWLTNKSNEHAYKN